MSEKAVITLTRKRGKLDVRVEFTPSAKTAGPMKPTHSAAMAALKGINAWSKGGAS